MSHWNPFSKSYIVKCDDGSEKHVYKRVDDAFPLELAGFDVRVTGRFKDTFQNQTELQAEVRKMVDAQLFSISDRNNGLMMEFRAAYIVFQSDPCSQSDFFKKQVKEILAEQRELRAFDAELARLENLIKGDLNKGQEVYSKLRKLSEDLDLHKQQQLAVSQAFESSRNAINSLLE